MRLSYVLIFVLFPVFWVWSGMDVLANPVTFSYTGNVQTYQVPKGVTSLLVDVQGAAGGNTTMSRGGYGGRVQGQLDVVGGEIIYLYIGGAGPNSTTSRLCGGFNGGGAGSGDGCGGGGASDIRQRGTALSNRVVVAGGGGGGCGPTYVVSKNYDRGGDGGGLIGETGYSNGTDIDLQNDFAGIGGASKILGNGNFRNGAFGIGGNGYAYYVGGGGGGGGYYGGGGGNENGGGGGSSYSDPMRTSSIVHTQGYNTEGNGIIIITPIIPMNVIQPQNQDIAAGGRHIQGSGLNPYSRN